MTQQEISLAKDLDLIASIDAMQRAALLARKIAVQTDTAIIVLQHEKIVRRTAAELKAQSLQGNP